MVAVKDNMILYYYLCDGSKLIENKKSTASWLTRANWRAITLNITLRNEKKKKRNISKNNTKTPQKPEKFRLRDVSEIS